MHDSLSICTVPLSSFTLAPVGHTVVHSGVAQCWHCIGRKYMSTSGNWAPSYLGVGPTRMERIQ